VRAVRLTGPRLLDLVELPDPVPADDEVVLRVTATGICGSDLSCYKTGVFSGSVLGHEFAGVIEGPGVDGFATGTPVLVDPKVPCGNCDDCRSGSGYRCTAALTLGPGGMRDGGFAELVSVPAHCLYPMPAGLRIEDGCLTEPLAVAIHGLERARAQPGEDAIVVGLGPIGLLAIAVLRERGAGRIIGVDPVEVRRTLATRLGADDAVARVEEAKAGAPLVIECTGKADLLQDVTNLAASGGRVLLLGVAVDQSNVTTMVWVVREVSVIGSVASSPGDFLASAELLSREPGIARIITRRVSLDDLPAAFSELVGSPAEGKVVAEPAR
jgi:(R,R)-butanediol dehydrogenase / meso-butanediol dehydrogenase / diacetyl reductase